MSESQASSQRTAMRRVVQDLVTYTNRNKRNISARFHLLPSKQDAPDFYARIKHPRSFSSVQKALNEGRYATPKTLYEDLKLIFLQGQDYYKRSSEAYRDCDKMNSTLDDVWTAEVLLPSLEEMEVKRTRGEEEEVDETGAKRRLDRLTPQELEYLKSFGKETHAFHTAYARAVNSGQENDAVEVDDDPHGAAPSSPGSREPSPLPIATPAPVRVEDFIQPPPALTLMPNDPADSYIYGRPLPAQTNNYASGSTKAEIAKPTRDVGSDAEEDAPQASGQQFALATDDASGWMQTPASKSVQAVLGGILGRLKAQVNHHTGALLSAHLQQPPTPAYAPKFYQVEGSLTLSDVDQRLAANKYDSAEAFDRDLNQVFRTARAWLTPQKSIEGYNDLLALQRSYQELTKGDGTAQLDHQGPVKLKAASTPGRIRAEDQRQTTKDRVFFPSIEFKGEKYQPGDWVHLYNRDRPSKPIIGQVWKVYKKRTTGQRYLNVCWYFRPEETVHPVTRTFYEHEVFKTSLFIDHEVEDVMQRCLVLYHSKYVRGRPAVPYWTPDMPTYVVEHRFRDKSFKKIKNWSTCIPDEVRSSEPEIVPFPDGPKATPKVKSPFARGDQQEDVLNGVSGESTELPAADLISITLPPPTPAHSARVSAPRPYAATGGAEDKGPSAIELAASHDQFDPLPSALVSRFRTDPGSGELLWFPSPAVSVQPSQHASHTLDYLYHLATQSRQIVPQKRGADALA